MFDDFEPENSTAEDINLPPKENDFLVGQDAAEKQLLESWNSGKMPHGWLFYGSKGVGKATLAYRLIRFVLTQGQNDASNSLFGDAPLEATSLSVSMEAPAVQRLIAGGHADVLIIEPPQELTASGQAKDIPVEAIRKIAPFLRLTSAEGGWRVVFIDEADKLNRSGQNAILKILEEPPEKTLLILTAQNPGAFLPTIISRVRKLSLKPLESQDLTTILKHYRPHLGEEELSIASALSENSVGKALEFIDNDGVELYQSLISLLQMLPQLDRPKASEILDKILRDRTGKKWVVFSSLLIEFLQNFAKSYALGKTPKLILEEEAGIYAVLMRQGNHPVLQRNDRWIEIWIEARQAMEMCKRSSLDRKQSVLNILDLIAAAIAV